MDRDKNTFEEKINRLKMDVDEWLTAKKGEMEAKKTEVLFAKRRREIEDSLSDQAEDVKLKIKDRLDQLQNRAEALWHKIV
jgi:hypothetical protein